MARAGCGECARLKPESLAVTVDGRNIHELCSLSIEESGDAALVRNLLENLLGNAWKYSSRREHAHIEFGSTRQDDGNLTYFVRDNGVGFDSEESEGLFDPFSRLRHDYEGTGVGLAIVKRVVTRHGGRVWAESAVDQGATFFFTLPDIASPA